MSEGEILKSKIHASPGPYATDKNKSARQPHRIRTWNVRGLNQPGKLHTVENEMERKDI
ncbi:hypothetical protein KGM_201815 [Danaus plexippus plexippus]|uniref:Uncharacterized protein n=1 Tax=Danaus plexippus plexippus TaxID=278856 RepID=A0A212FJ21_DANPL|nr:hypothetical protein KGM_201815 [Danaus plexippus plexippus]